VGAGVAVGAAVGLAAGTVGTAVAGATVGGATAASSAGGLPPHAAQRSTINSGAEVRRIQRQALIPSLLM
jgi:hypothetical protein